MTGVEILAMEEIAVSFDFNWLAFWIVFGIIFGLFSTIGIVVGIETYDLSCAAVCITFGVILSLILGGLSGDEFGTPTEYETRYKVTISDEVSMNDFLERYEILDQEGKIYTVRERDGVKDGE